MMTRIGLWIVIPLCLWLVLSGCRPASDTASVVPPVTDLPSEQTKALFPNSIGRGKPAILDAYSKFCLACRQLTPKLEAIVETSPTIVLERVDVQSPRTQDKAIIQAFHITMAPYVAFITSQGKVTRVFLDDVPASELEAAAATLIHPSPLPD